MSFMQYQLNFSILNNQLYHLFIIIIIIILLHFLIINVLLLLDYLNVLHLYYNFSFLNLIYHLKCYNINGSLFVQSEILEHLQEVMSNEFLHTFQWLLKHNHLWSYNHYRYLHFIEIYLYWILTSLYFYQIDHSWKH